VRLMTRGTDPSFLRAALQPLGERRTYLRMAYLALGLPLGTAYLVYLTTMLAVGFSLAVTLVGFPIVAYTLVTARSLTAFDCRLTERLLGAQMPLARQAAIGGKSFLGNALARLGDRAAWRNVLYLAVRFPLGVLDFTVVVTLLWSVVWCLGNPIYVGFGGSWNIGTWRIDTVGEALLFVLPGLVLLIVTPRAVSGLTALSESITTRMVGRMSYAELRQATVRVLAGGRELDGPGIVTQLILYNGSSVDISPANVYAVLRGLEGSGLVELHADGEYDHFLLTSSGEAVARAT
jgi:Putative sensor